MTQQEFEAFYLSNFREVHGNLLRLIGSAQLTEPTCHAFSKKLITVTTQSAGRLAAFFDPGSFWCPLCPGSSISPACRCLSSVCAMHDK
ncbi:MAG: hypothetical protein VB055_10490 [Oscillospiraceae bacterium]|nr:hypothetical protein [Oscillospiraceae bacterium]